MMFKSINGGGGGGGGGSAIHHPKISESGPQPIDTLIYLYPPPLNTFLHTLWWHCASEVVPWCYACEVVLWCLLCSAMGCVYQVVLLCNAMVLCL